MIKMVLAPLAFVAMLVGFAGETHAQNLEGRWHCVGQCQIPNGRTLIEQRGNRLTLYNEVRQPSRGYLADPYTIVATDWGITGRISEDGGSIRWRGTGTRWVR